MRTFIALVFLAVTGCGILEEDISSKQVALLAPVDRAAVAAGAVDFHWQALQYATGYEFMLAAPSFEQAARIVADTVIYADSLDRGFRFRTTLPAGDYQWSVTAFNGGYSSQPQIRTLTVHSAE